MIWQRTYVTFESDYSLAESVERLSAATRRPRIATIGPQAAVGKVEAGKVRLCRVIPYVNNSFKPMFTGAFEETEGRVVLRGSFGMHVVVKVFMCVWFGGLLVMTLPFAWNAWNDGRDGWIGVFVALGMSAAGAAITGLGMWFARNDVTWISNVIQRALKRESR